MDKQINGHITALGVQICVVGDGTQDDFISITDIARYKSDEPKMVIQNWMRNRNTIEFLGVWEEIHNPRFKGIEFDAFKKEAGLNSFILTPTKWISATQAIGIRSKRGRYGGTYAHMDIAFEFASWISPEFKLYVIEDYRRLKADESSRLSLGWNEKRLFSKINYQIHTEAVKSNLIPDIAGKGAHFTYATEADVLNVALFGKTVKQWRDENLGKLGNIRDAATLRQLVVLANLESMNAQLIKAGASREERAEYLNAMAREQFAALEGNPTLKALERKLQIDDADSKKQ